MACVKSCLVGGRGKYLTDAESFKNDWGQDQIQDAVIITTSMDSN